MSTVCFHPVLDRHLQNTTVTVSGQGHFSYRRMHKHPDGHHGPFVQSKKLCPSKTFSGVPGPWRILCSVTASECPICSHNQAELVMNV